MTPAFPTGSRIYGTPTADSDVDLVVPMSKETLSWLMRFSDTSTGAYRFGTSLRFGRLNIIAVVDEGAYNVWAVGTQQCIDATPIDKEHATPIFEDARRTIGPWATPDHPASAGWDGPILLPYTGDREPLSETR